MPQYKCRHCRAVQDFQHDADMFKRRQETSCSAPGGHYFTKLEGQRFPYPAASSKPGVVVGGGGGVMRTSMRHPGGSSSSLAVPLVPLTPLVGSKRGTPESVSTGHGALVTQLTLPPIVPAGLKRLAQGSGETGWMGPTQPSAVVLFPGSMPLGAASGAPSINPLSGNWAVALEIAFRNALEPRDAWKSREVSKAWRQFVDKLHWFVVPQKIDAVAEPLNDELANDELAKVAFGAMLHLRKTFVGGALVAKQDAQAVKNALKPRYSQLSKKDIENNCVALYDVGGTTFFVLNFFCWKDSFVRMFDPIGVDSFQATGATNVMRKIDWMHAEVRILHERHDSRSIDKEMCVFCSATFGLLTLRPRRSHGGELKWYTFSSYIFATRERLRQFFGDAFAMRWMACDNATRRRLLSYCVALTNQTLFENVSRRVTSSQG